MLAVGTGESQLHAATEHIARALGATSVSLLAVLADPEAAYLVADSGEVEIRPVRLPLEQHPYLRRAIEVGEVTIVGGGEAASAVGVAGAADASAVFPVLIGRKPAGALVARFDGAEAARLAEASVGLGRVAASLFGMVLRGAQGARSAPRAHPARHAPRCPRGATGARHRALPRLHRQRLRRDPRPRRRRAWSST